VLIVLREHPQPRWFDRIAEYAEAFATTSLPVEPFAYTQDELNRMLAARAGFVQTILREVIPLSGDGRVWLELKCEKVSAERYAADPSLGHCNQSNWE